MAIKAGAPMQDRASALKIELSIAGLDEITRKSTNSRIKLGMTRIRNTLKKVSVATLRTLESKVSEASPKRVEPRIVSQSLKRLIAIGEVIEVSPRNGIYGAFYALRTTPLERVKAQLKTSRMAYRAYRRIADNGTLGEAAEKAWQEIFSKSHIWTPLHISKWGSISKLWGRSLAPSADGLAVVNRLIESTDSYMPYCLVEIKNRREWTYALCHELWGFIHNCLKLGITGIFICRRASTSAITYVAHRLGILILEMYCQLIPSRQARALKSVQDKAILGFHDLKTANEASWLHKRIDGISKEVPDCHARIQLVRPVISVYAEMLAQPHHSNAKRRRVFAEMLAALESHGIARRTQH